MTFGKYRGLWLHELPEDYLGWLVSLPDLREPLLTAVMGEWWDRSGHSGRSGRSRRTGRSVSRPRPDAVNVGDVELFADLVESGYRATAKKLHPDVTGGDGEKMRRLNVLVGELREQLKAR